MPQGTEPARAAPSVEATSTGKDADFSVLTPFLRRKQGSQALGQGRASASIDFTEHRGLLWVELAQLQLPAPRWSALVWSHFVWRDLHTNLFLNMVPPPRKSSATREQNKTAIVPTAIRYRASQLAPFRLGSSATHIPS